MEIINNPEKNPENGKLQLLVRLDRDESLILEQALRAFDKYDKDDNKYVTRLTHVTTVVHDIWKQLHPS